MSTLRDRLQQTSDRLLIYRFGNLGLTALADTLGRDVPEAAQDGDYIFKFLYEQAQAETPDKEQTFYKILIEPFAAPEGVS